MVVLIDQGCKGWCYIIGDIVGNRRSGYGMSHDVTNDNGREFFFLGGFLT